MKRHTEVKIAGMLRVLLVGITIVLQILLMVMLIVTLRSYAVIAYGLIEVVALFVVLGLVNKEGSSSYKIAWLLLISALPLFGQVLYLLWGRGIKNKRHSSGLKSSMDYGQQFLTKDSGVYARLGLEHPGRKRLAGFLGRKGFPVYENTRCSYYPLGELQFAAMIEEMKKAERFIFIETFILTSGQLWDEVCDVLVKKAAEGVEVRLMFDDFGSIITAPGNLVGELAAKGIKATRFNPIHLYVSRLYINYRNHQKITVIDGRIGYTGGTNYADEYVNLYPKHGHWKDTAIRLEGDAVWSLTVNFLQMWDGNTGDKSDYALYKTCAPCRDAKGFFQPFCDGPLNNPDNPAEAAYLNIIANAREYVYIATPYLIIDESMINNLCTAAESGVDVRIITPKIWDKWYVHTVTSSNYGVLLKAGVRIFEYTPGFIHAKTIISDDDSCISGTINMDYRSFNLHFENGVWICGAPVLEAIRKDMLDTVGMSGEIDLETWEKRPMAVKALEGILRAFAVLL